MKDVGVRIAELFGVGLPIIVVSAMVIACLATWVGKYKNKNIGIVIIITYVVAAVIFGIAAVSARKLL